MINSHRLHLARLIPFVLGVLFCLPLHAAPSIVVDTATSRVLHAEEIFARWRPASLTKLMTAYVAFREVDAGNLTLRSPVRISLDAARMPPSHMAYPIGTIVTLDNALKIIIVKSANDVAFAIGEAVSGTQAAFVERMNAEADRLGMTDTRFANANGLHDDDQYTTARDFAVLTQAIRKEFPQHASYFSTEAISTAKSVFKNHNSLIGRFDGADGMKTGYICESGFNLAATATRKGNTLIAVVLGEISPKIRAKKAAILLDKGFRSIADPEKYPFLQDLEKPNDASQAVADMRSFICSDAGRAARSKAGAGPETTLLKAMNRPPVAVPVRSGGARGSSMSATLVLGQMIRQIPVPVVKPERMSLPDESDRVKYALQPGFEVPVPDSRPES